MIVQTQPLITATSLPIVVYHYNDVTLLLSRPQWPKSRFRYKEPNKNN